MEINLTRNLRTAMANAKIDQKHLAEASGCSRAAVSQYLSGKYMPGKDALQRLAAALNVTVDWLFAEHGSGTCSPAGKITVMDAARCMGVSRAFVQNGIMDGSLDIGVAVRIKKRFAFYIIPGKLRDMVGEDRFTAFFGGGGQNGNNPNR